MKNLFFCTFIIIFLASCTIFSNDNFSQEFYIDETIDDDHSSSEAMQNEPNFNSSSSNSDKLQEQSDSESSLSSSVYEDEKNSEEYGEIRKLDYINFTNCYGNAFFEHAQVGDEFMGLIVESIRHEETFDDGKWNRLYFVSFSGEIELHGEIVITPDSLIYFEIDKDYSSKIPLPRPDEYDKTTVEGACNDIWIRFTNMDEVMDYLSNKNIIVSNSIIRYPSALLVNNYAFSFFGFGGGESAYVVSIDGNIIP